MEIFWRLVLAHFMSDFTLQTNLIANWKRQSWKGMAIHVATHPVVMTILLWPYLMRTWLETPWFSLPGWACLIIITLTHWIEDEWRVWMIRSDWPDTTGLLVWDQFVHISIIYAIAPRFADLPVQPWVGIALCAVILAHTISVLIFFLENEAGGNSQVLQRNKYRFIAERFMGAGLLMLPGWWLVLGLGWIGSWAVFAWRRPQTYTRVHVMVGAFSSLVLGLIARAIFNGL